MDKIVAGTDEVMYHVLDTLENVLDCSRCNPLLKVNMQLFIQRIHVIL